MKTNKEFDSLVVSEKFISIQGEGVTAGIPAVFIRLSGCNLLCQSQSWICDTIEVWKKGTKTKFKDVLPSNWIDELRKRTHLVFTGGEPLLHAKAIYDYLCWFVGQYEFYPIVEIETNGTISPPAALNPFVHYWNVSPKLPNSGETAIRRINKEAISDFNSVDFGNVMFKFVIEKDSDVDDLINEYLGFIDASKVVLMPAGDSQELLNKTRLNTVKLCQTYGFRFSDRLHIVIWNQKTGV